MSLFDDDDDDGLARVVVDRGRGRVRMVDERVFDVVSLSGRGPYARIVEMGCWGCLYRRQAMNGTKEDVPSELTQYTWYYICM